MSTFAKILAVVALIVSAMAVMPDSAQARHRGGWHHGGHWHGGGWGPGFGFGYPYAYYPQPYYYGGCGWVRVRVWRGDHWGVRRVRRC